MVAENTIAFLRLQLNKMFRNPATYVIRKWCRLLLLEIEMHQHDVPPGAALAELPGFLLDRERTVADLADDGADFDVVTEIHLPQEIEVDVRHDHCQVIEFQFRRENPVKRFAGQLEPSRDRQVVDVPEKINLTKLWGHGACEHVSC